MDWRGRKFTPPARGPMVRQPRAAAAFPRQPGALSFRQEFHFEAGLWPHLM